MWFNSIGLVLLLQSVIFASASVGTCDNSYSIDSTRDIDLRSPNYPSKYTPGTMCRYYFRAMVGYSIIAVCNLNIYKNSNSGCETDKLLISTDNDRDFRGASQYCGNGRVTKESEYNTISLALISTSSGYGGTFNCTISVKPQPCDCGWSQRGRIVGGTNAAATQYPSIVALGEKSGSNIFCDGTIISSRSVITAAHCTRLHPRPDELFILCGYTYLSSTTDSPYGRTYGVSQINEHPSYNPNTEANDIAILITSTEMDWSRGIGPGCLPFNTLSTFEYTRVNVCGWGTTSFGGPRSGTLQDALLTVLSNSVCMQVYGNLQPSQMCTYAQGKDACQFDSGGPVFNKTAMGIQYLIGVISSGIDCGQNPGLNTRITSFISWIRQNSVGVLCYKPLP